MLLTPFTSHGQFLFAGHANQRFLTSLLRGLVFHLLQYSEFKITSITERPIQISDITSFQTYLRVQYWQDLFQAGVLASFEFFIWLVCHRRAVGSLCEPDCRNFRCHRFLQCLQNLSETCKTAAPLTAKSLEEGDWSSISRC